ncbi:MdtA/MuxA family multidrug efflux RND transporter periplasmic adaptor subunit [Caballeronia mineralivorans]|jgi:multidrug efflux system membrane fusion protein|uniref:MdtA/MuxA family multidrug efflux RND transporter periplasmic adaptor subunit n=1 Tax=Caballeronia mineralivorans TaxID=2010198 RepID=UPI002AFDF114|nr:MdtA/MuxA family multidrug efflux RND transporter periplasmic adaptor subunit [Caballeronia mineralivorans]MEA3099883.1 rane fusion protein multidrug efflux system [Caballeronia mineralivorans]
MDEQKNHPAPPPHSERRSPTSQASTPPPSAAQPRRRRLLWIVVAILIVAGLFAWHPWNRGGANNPQQQAGGGRRGGGPGGPGGPGTPAPPQPVHVATVTQGEMPVVINSLGTVTPLASVTVKTLLNGTLQDVAFQEGQMVKKGDVLAQIDPRPYEISLRNAQGTLAKDQALLQTARLDLKRYQMLLSQDSIASQQVDTQASLVQQLEGTVKADQASVDTFRLDLTYARITAPVSGRVGLRQVDPGNYVTTSDTNGVVVITQLQPISVIFTTSEDNLTAILKPLHAGTKMSVTAYDRANTTSLESGYLETIDNQIDTTTGTVKLRARFDNKESMLFPNQFVNTKLLVDVIKDATIVPTPAVLNGSSGAFVYVVKPDNTVTVRNVKIGPVDGERTSIKTGLQVGERVVIDGSDRLKEGAKITIPADKPKAASGASGAAASAARGASGAHRGHHRPASQ